jgi:hypothetical protein
MALTPQQRADIEKLYKSQQQPAPIQQTSPTSTLTPERRAEIEALYRQQQKPSTAPMIAQQKAQQPAQPQRNNLLTSISKPFIKTVAAVPALIGGVSKFAQGDVAGASDALTRERNFGMFGSTRPIGINQETGQKQSFGELAKDVVGTGAEIASYLAPGAVGVGSKAIGATGKVLPSIRSLGKAGALAGGIGSFGAGLQQDQSFGQTLKEAGTGMLAGGLLGASIPGITRGVSSVTRGTARGLGETGKYLGSQISGLTPQTGRVAFSGKLTDTAMKQTPQEFGERIVKKLQSVFDSRYSELQELGRGYDEKRALTNKVPIKRTVSGLPEFVVQTLKKDFGIDVDQAGQLVLSERSRASARDVRPLQEFLDQYGRASYINGDVMLNIRQALDRFIDWGGGSPNIAADNIAKKLRMQYDKYAKTHLPGLAKLDDEFAPEKQFLDDLKGILYESETARKQGQLRGGAYSDIANLLSTSKTVKRERLEKLLPGVSDEVMVLKALEDMERAYIRAGLATSGATAGLATANIPMIAAALLYGTFGTPENFVRAIRAFGQANKKFGSLLANTTANKILRGKALGQKEIELLKAVVQSAQRAGAIQAATGQQQPEGQRSPQVE